MSMFVTAVSTRFGYGCGCIDVSSIACTDMCSVLYKGEKANDGDDASSETETETETEAERVICYAMWSVFFTCCLYYIAALCFRGDTYGIYGTYGTYMPLPLSFLFGTSFSGQQCLEVIITIGILLNPPWKILVMPYIYYY